MHVLQGGAAIGAYNGMFRIIKCESDQEVFPVAPCIYFAAIVHLSAFLMNIDNEWPFSPLSFYDEWLDQVETKTYPLLDTGSLTPTSESDSTESSSDYKLGSVSSSEPVDISDILVDVSRETPKPHNRRKLSQTQKIGHNKIEKKYRNNINTKLEILHRLVPWNSTTTPNFQGKGDHNKLIHKVSKSMILDGATEYIKQLIEREKRLKDECDGLRKQLTQRTCL